MSVDKYDGSKVERWYNDSSKRHREDGPAVIWYHKDGKIRSERWFRDDKPY